MRRMSQQKSVFVTVFTLAMMIFYPLLVIAQSKVDKIDQFMTKVYENRQFNGTVLVTEKISDLQKGIWFGKYGLEYAQ